MHVIIIRGKMFRLVPHGDAPTGKELQRLLDKVKYTQADFARIVRANTGLKTTHVNVNGMINGRMTISETIAAVYEAVDEVAKQGGVLPPSVNGNSNIEEFSKSGDLTAALRARMAPAMTAKEFSAAFAALGVTHREFAERATALGRRPVDASSVANAASGKVAPWPEMVELLERLKRDGRMEVVIRKRVRDTVVSRPIAHTTAATNPDNPIFSKIVDLRLQAKSLRDIGAAVGMSHEAVRKILEDGGRGDLTARVRRQIVL